ncbi:MAG: biotin--[Oscillospiraceae bacterium]|nr:biotin--[acetyl-CoA-carboxylase] ligase [Oscillospiraceae bacterium]
MNLSAEKIKEKLHPFFHRVELIDTAESTNTLMKKTAGQTRQGHVIIARHQTGGRGRNGRIFYSRKDRGIYLSFLLKPQLDIQRLQGITAAVAVAAARAAEQVCGVECGIKWVNDIYVNDRKIAGILCETALKPGTASLEYLVVGLGMNVYPAVLPPDIAYTAGCVADYAVTDFDANDLVCAFLNNFYSIYSGFEDKGFMEYYRRHCVLSGCEITVLEKNGSYSAKAVGVDDRGRLIIEKDGERQLLSSGEITVRKNGPL